MPFTLIGRSSSSFTRIARIFAAELGISYAFDLVLELKSLDPQDYGGNPALKVAACECPVLARRQPAPGAGCAPSGA